MIADYLQENPWLLGVGLLSFLSGIFVAIYTFRTPAKKPSKKDKEPSKSKKSK